MSDMELNSGDSICELSKSPQTFTNEDINQLKSKVSEEVPLQTEWTFWYDKSVPGDPAEEFTKNLKDIYKVKTVEGFWAVFNNIPSPDELQVRYSYHFMKEDRRPVWEDKANENGGSWRFKVNKMDTKRVWQELLLAAIGEQFVDCMAEDDEVCGVTVTVRERDDLIQVWNLFRELAPKASVISKIRELLPDVHFLTDFYKSFQTHHAYGGSSNYSYKQSSR